MTPAHVLSQLVGSTIADWFVEDEQGLHLVLEDGRIFIVAGVFAIGISRTDMKELH